jgi:Cu/Ag efflux pump CusA
MMRWIVRSSLKYQRLVLAVAVAMLAAGVVQVRATPLQTLPEFSPVQVEVQTEALGLSSEEVEQLITNPMENEFFNGLPWLSKLESKSIPGLSSIVMTFEPGTDLIKARQVVQERLTMVTALPAAASRAPMVVQPLSSTSRLMMIGLSSRNVSLIDMSVLARWTIAQRLLGVPGVANVTVWGMRDRQLQVQIDPRRLQQHHVLLDQVLRTAANALWVSPLTFVEASTPGTGGFVDTTNQRIEVQHNQPIRTAKDLAQVTVEGAKLRLGDVATIVEDHQLLIGDAVVHDAPSLMLVVERFPGTNVAQVSADVQSALDSLKPGLTGIDVDTTVYRPATFVETMTRHLGLVLAIGLGLLVLLLLGLFASWRAIAVTIGTVATSAATTLVVLRLLHTPLTMVAIAGLVLALAVIVDDAIAVVTSGPPRETDPWVRARTPLLVGTVVAGVSVVPALLLNGFSGAFLRPVAVAYLAAIAVSTVVAIALGAVLANRLLRARFTPGSSPLRRAEAAYAGLLARLRSRPAWAYAGAGLFLVAGLAVLPLLGGRPTTPTLQDRSLLIQWEGAPGTSRPEMNRVMAAASAELRTVPGVIDVGGEVGRALASDKIVGINSGELWVTLDPSARYAATIDAIENVVSGYPGVRHHLMTYSDEQVQQARTGGDEDLVIRVYGNDYATLRSKAAEVTRIISGIPGVTGPRVKTEGDVPTVHIEVSVAKAARYGLKPGDVRRAAATLVSGTVAGSLFQDQKVFDVVVWGTPDVRQNLNSIADLRVDAPTGGLVRLGDIATVTIKPTPEIIAHDQVSRSVDVVAAVSGRPLGPVTQDVKQRLSQVRFPQEHHLEVLGDSQARQSSRLHLLTYVLAAALVMYFILQAGLGGWRSAALLFLLLPVAASGGLLVGAILHARMSTVALMGLLAPVAMVARWGMAMLSGQDRFRQIVASAIASVGILAPLAILSGVSGLEMAGPLAAVAVGGIVSAALVILFVLPVLDHSVLDHHAVPAAEPG